MTKQQSKWLRRTADFVIPVCNVGLMLAIWFGTHLSLPLKLITFVIILLIGNIIKYEIKKKLIQNTNQ